jgi:hypothetical protein
MAIEGVDYSSTANADWAGLAQSLKAAGKQFVGRYAVNDKSPGGRGIGAAEYAAMRDAGVDVFLYWESSEGWMTGGWEAGVYAAQNAQWNLEQAGIPANVPVYFACDFDASPGHQAAIDSCLYGAASVLGANRVGLYAGYHVLLRSKQNGSAQWFCQTSAWSGGQVMEGAHLYQYAYNKYVYGTNCDWVQAYTENYGQATPPFHPAEEQPKPPKPPKTPTFPEPVTYPWLTQEDGTVHEVGGTRVLPLTLTYTATRATPRYQKGSKTSAKVGKNIPKGMRFRAHRVFRSAEGVTFVLTPHGTRVLASALLPRVGVTASGRISVRHEGTGAPEVISDHVETKP